MIKLVEVYLLIFSLLDFTTQIIAQLPIFTFEVKDHKSYEVIGFRKIWHENPNNPMSYSSLINTPQKFEGMILGVEHFVFQIFNCAIVCILSLQT